MILDNFGNIILIKNEVNQPVPQIVICEQDCKLFVCPIVENLKNDYMIPLNFDKKKNTNYFDDSKEYYIDPSSLSTIDIKWYDVVAQLKYNTYQKFLYKLSNFFKTCKEEEKSKVYKEIKEEVFEQNRVLKIYLR